MENKGTVIEKKNIIKNMCTVKMFESKQQQYINHNNITTLPENGSPVQPRWQRQSYPPTRLYTTIQRLKLGLFERK